MSSEIKDDIVGHDSKSEQLQKEYYNKWSVPWKNVQDAIDQGYVYPGWKLKDYLMATDKGNPNLPKNPYCSCGAKFQKEELFEAHLKANLDHIRRPRKPFEYVDTWGVQGASKSAFIIRKLYELYGNYDTVIDRMLLEKDMVIAAYEEVPEPEQRIPAACMDDLNTIISKQEWFIDKEFYILFHKFLNTIRTKFGTVFSTLPNVEFTPDMLGDVITFEVIIYPNSTYKVERYCWDIHPWEPVKAKFTKIVVETGVFDIYQTPPDVWAKYQRKRFEVANRLFIQMKDYMASGGKKGQEKNELVRKGLKGVNIDDVVKAWRRDCGVKISSDDARKLVTKHREMLQAAAIA